MTPFAATPFDQAMRGARATLEFDGQRLLLPVTRWHAEPDSADELLLARCGGATLDVGCGPGRLTAARPADGFRTTQGAHSWVVLR